MYLGPVPFLFVNSAARRSSMAAGFEGKFLSSFLYLLCFHLPYLVVHVYELITCVQRANENAGNLISVDQFLINKYLFSLKAGPMDNAIQDFSLA